LKKEIQERYNLQIEERLVLKESVFFIDFKMVRTTISLYSEYIKESKKNPSLFQGGIERKLTDYLALLFSIIITYHLISSISGSSFVIIHSSFSLAK
jgi:hypothetical protein